MPLVFALEGPDGVGKSTAHRRAVGRLLDAGAKAVPSKEPGSVQFGQDGDSWDEPKPPMSLEPHLETTALLLGLAAHVADDRFFRQICLAAASVAQSGRYPPSLHKALMPRGSVNAESVHVPNRSAIQDRWESLQNAVGMSPVLQEKLRRRTSRDVVRQAILHASDADSRPPTATGLMFFADHYLHGQMADGLPEPASLVTDRTHLSQRAYARVRGDDRRVIRLYDAHRPLEVDRAYVLTASKEALRERVDGSDTTAGWDDKISQLMSVQEAYREIAGEVDCEVRFIDTTGEEPADTAQALTEDITSVLSRRDT